MSWNAILTLGHVMTWCKLHPPEFYKDDILQREHSSQCIELIGEYVEKRRNIQHAGSLSRDSQAHNKVFFYIHDLSVMSLLQRGAGSSSLCI